MPTTFRTRDGRPAAAGPRLPGSPPSPRPMLLFGLAAVLAVTGWIVWRRSQQPAPPDHMAAATVLRQETDGDRTRLTVRFTADGKPRTATHEVSTDAFVAQGRVAWICYAAGDPGDTRVRLPFDPLC
ncbi:hypothetical protein PZ938_01495 [Luteipulveratus sp. YIM 133132]|uniref:hypothetical protein n=1 Tax=Luteipulveratus flavus TaxID=3031728 RepID=UPI0023AEF271|nr:hypothetical protein [Luteipulveratus sp. YIM 133132]MDE9364268.1 hypothetical protein [Luteipulveratus sp. YIM 133132]